MKIIQHGTPKVTTKIFECSDCGCVFEAEKDEYTYGVQYNEEYYYCKCPECGKQANETKNYRRSNCGFF